MKFSKAALTISQALGLYIPPGFVNIKWGMFIVFGCMCLLAAVQFYFTYPETCGKTLEEIEFMFSPEGPRPWHTKKGHSRLDAMVDEARAKQLKIGDITEGKHEARLGIGEAEKDVEKS